MSLRCWTASQFLKLGSLSGWTTEGPLPRGSNPWWGLRALSAALMATDSCKFNISGLAGRVS